MGNQGKYVTHTHTTHAHCQYGPQASKRRPATLVHSPSNACLSVVCHAGSVFDQKYECYVLEKLVVNGKPEQNAKKGESEREIVDGESVVNNVSGAAVTTAAASGLVRWELQPSDLASPALP